MRVGCIDCITGQNNDCDKSCKIFKIINLIEENKFIFCEDCRYFNKQFEECTWFQRRMSKDDFCSFGMKKENKI